MSGRGPAAGFDAFVRSRGARLLRTAHLLCGDRERADVVLERALARTWRGWRRARTVLDVENAALAHLVAVAAELPALPVPETDRLLPEGIGIGSPAEIAGRAGLRRSLSLLTPQQRAVLVLRHAEGLPVQRVAEVLRTSPAEVAEAERAALGAVRT